MTSTQPSSPKAAERIAGYRAVRDAALADTHKRAGLLCGDPVLLPFDGDKPNWNIDRRAISSIPIEVHWSDAERLAVLVDSFYRLDPTIPKGADVSVVAWWDATGTPHVHAIDGDPDYGGQCESLVLGSIRSGKRLEPAAANDNHPRPTWLRPVAVASRTNSIDAQSLLAMDFPPVEWTVPGYITEGLTLLAGRPKLGKSWLALGMCVAVATGGTVLGVDVPQGDAFYLALEDNQRRLKDRLKVVLPPPIVAQPDVSRLRLQTPSVPTVDAGLIPLLDAWRHGASEPKLVVIDTLAKVRPARKGNQDQYAADYAAIIPLQEWALKHRIAVVVVHHVRKMEAEDPLESVSGTNGITGAADTTLVLTRDQDGPKLYGRGRDVEDVEKALRFDAGIWSVLGNADEVKQSDTRRKILQVLTEATGMIEPKEIAEQAGVTGLVVRQILPKLVKDGKVEKVGYGQYKLTGR